MAKLQAPSKSGFNAGDSYNVKYIPIDKIVIDPEISSKFEQSEDVIEDICQSILRDGFHKEQPVTLWGKILVDGHQRRLGAKKAGLVEIPYIEKEFASREEAILYTFERQIIRRNLTPAEILYAASLIPNEKAKNGEGRATEVWAKRLGVSYSTISRAKSILENAPEEDIQAVREGKASIKKTFNKNKNNKKPQNTEKQEIQFVVNDSQSLPANVKFLKTVIVLMLESKKTNPAEIAELLINHFLKKNEKKGFYKLLPDEISAQLPEGQLVSGTLIDP